jgi:hypothetical protein
VLVSSHPSKRSERFNSVVTPMLVMAMAGSLVANGNQAGPPGNWLDRPLAGWNTSGMPLPKISYQYKSRSETTERCHLSTPVGATSIVRSLTDAGWIAFLNFDQKLVRDDVEVMGGMTDADGLCRPTGYNLFVFVGGRFAGTLSPSTMDSRLDGSSGAVRITAADTITADFSRYAPADALCCPSSRVTVYYHIDRSGPKPVVVPTDIRKRL